jgi:serine/threonine-protein kinase
MSVRPGTRLDGRYRLADRLAYGGMGEVWRAMDEVLSREVAVKILRPELAEDEAFVRRFRAEARTTSGLPHNGIAAVYDYGETRVGADGQSPAPYEDQDADPVAYLVMELVPGEALSSILSRDGALGSELTLDLVAQAARALHAAHLKGVIHRDIKPANLMVTPEGRVKVTDFGIARPLDHEPLTATGQVMGTAHYLAPELAKGQDASPLSDVYALGVVAYECLAGHRPFEGDNQVAVALAHLNEQPPPLPATIPAQVRAVVGSAMEKDPQRRMPSAEAFAGALETLRYRQNGDDHLTPGTGIIPGSAAYTGLEAAGLAPGPDRGWTPGGLDGAGAAGATAAVPPPGTHLLGPATAGQRHPAGAVSAQGAYGAAPAETPYQAGYEQNGYGQSGYGQSGYDQGGYSQGGYDQGGYDQGRYGGPPDPFRTPTAPGGLSVGGDGLRERPRRSIGGPILIIAALGTVLAVVLLIAWINGGGGGATPIQNDPSQTAPANPGTSPATSPTSRSSATSPATSSRRITTTTRTTTPRSSTPSTTVVTSTTPTSTEPSPPTSEPTTPPTTPPPPTTPVASATTPTIPSVTVPVVPNIGQLRNGAVTTGR